VGGDETRENATDPYCPSVWATPSNDIPLVVKGSKEFPSRCEGSRVKGAKRKVLETSAAGKGNTHKYTIYDVPELRECGYWKDRHVN
jgi:hypothetical protein